MKKVDERSGLEVLDRAECAVLLAERVVGRIALAGRGGVEIFPVNYASDGNEIVFRTAAGTKLDAAGRGEVCFEIDEFDLEARTGWSVVVHGRLEEVDASELGVVPWAHGPKTHWLRVVPTRVSGRRVALGD